MTKSVDPMSYGSGYVPRHCPQKPNIIECIRCRLRGDSFRAAERWYDL